MKFTFHLMRVATGFDEEGMLALDGEPRLLAVLVRLLDDSDVAPGQWFVEAGFGRRDGKGHPTFADLEAASGLDQPPGPIWPKEHRMKNPFG